jgi:hypothetical protein
LVEGDVLEVISADVDYLAVVVPEEWTQGSLSEFLPALPVGEVLETKLLGSVTLELPHKAFVGYLCRNGDSVPHRLAVLRKH